MILLYVHAGIMITGFIMVLSAVLIAAKARKKRWWLKTHKTIATVAGIAIFGGIVSAFILVTINTGEHFAKPHAFAGIFSFSIVLAALILGRLQFEFSKKVQMLRTVHRWIGRTSLLVLTITILSGLYLAA
jgi:hypothetical protein